MDSIPSPPLAAEPLASLGGRLALLLTLAVLTWIGLWQLRPPPIVPASAAATAFSAERAAEHLAVLAADSRAVGTAGHEAARQYLAERIRSLGLEPQVQTAPAHVRFPGASGFSAGMVQNVVTRVTGTDSTGTIVINAHYDSGTTGPGASDCGSCVVAALEAMRVVLAGTALRNDLVFVFSDAEEEGDLGAAAFVKEHPWAADVRLAINYEAQGSGGPALLYATSDDDGWIVRQLVEVAPNLSAYSWMGAVMELYPGGQLECDLAEYMKAGIQGFGFVYTSNTVVYHTAKDDVAHIDLGSIQQEGDYTVSLVQHFGNADLGVLPRDENSVFFNILPGVVAHYLYPWTVPLASLITTLIAALIVVGLRRGMLQLRQVAAATAVLAIGMLTAVVFSALLWVGIRGVNPDYQVTLIGNYQVNLYLAAFILTTVSVMSTFFVLIRRRWGINVFAGALFVWLPLLWLMSVRLPAMSYIATWPLVFAILPFGSLVLAQNANRDQWVRVSVLAVAAVPALVLLPATLHQAVALLIRFEGAAGVPLFGMTMLFVAPVVLLLVPQLNMLMPAPLYPRDSTELRKVVRF